MKVAVSATEPSLDSQVDPRFGRCVYFVLVDTDTMEFEAVENQNAYAGGGAGIQSGQLMVDKGVKTVLTGNCGPNAYRVLSAAGLELITGVSGTVRQAIEQYKSGSLKPSGSPNVDSHAGMGMGGGGGGRGMGRGMGGGGRGMGGGMGRGMGGGSGQGRGMGRGMGQGQGQDMQYYPASQPSEGQGMSREEEIGSLKEHAENLTEEVKRIQERIKELEKKK